MKFPRPKKHLGQNFLHDQNIIEKIVSTISPKPTDSLVEIGPGQGAITTKLLPLLDKLEVIEFDQEITPILKKNCGSSNKLIIHNKNVLKIDFNQFKTPIRLVGNLPYNISTPLIFYLIKNINLFKDLHFMLQKEVAERINAEPGSKIYGRLSIMVQYHLETKLLFPVGPRSFSPPPKVESSFIRLVPRKQFFIEAIDKNRFSEIVRSAFCQRRKVISNSLKKYISIQDLEKIGINPTERPEQLSVDDFVKISNVLNF